MKIITIATLKGGQAKTVISACLSRELAARNNRVLVLAIDSQNDINLYLRAEAGEKYLYDAIKDNNISSAIYNTSYENIDIVPYDINECPNIDQLLFSLPGSENRIKLLLRQVKDDYDFVICDTGPNLNISTIGAIVASDFLISPTTMRWSAINGFKATRNMVHEMIDLEMSNCKYLGIIRSMPNVTRNTETFEVEAYLDENKYPEIGVLPFSSALITSLYKKIGYDNLAKHHYSEVRNLFDNLLKQIA